MIKNKNLNREAVGRNLQRIVHNRELKSVIDHVVTSINLAPTNLGIGFGIIGVNFKVG